MTHRRWISWSVFSALCGIATVAFAGLWEFQTCSHLKGCDAIPYRETAAECEQYQKEVNKVCKTTGYGSEHREFEKLVATIKDDIRKLEEAKSRNNRSAIPGLETSINTNREKAKTIQAKAFGKIQEANECLFARQRVQRVFKDATTSVEVAGKSDPKLEPYASILVAKFNLGATEHVQAITDAQNASNNWTRVKNVTIP